jgi:type IV pilus assembly protein PilY1
MVENIVDYLRGLEIDGFRPRTRKLGDIVHAGPILVGNTLFVGANDGMLHAFDAVTGLERFAYVPNLVFENLTLLTRNDYEHKFFVDLSPVAMRRVGDGEITLLVGGLGKGGKGYYALDVTLADSMDPSTPEATVANMVLWEYPRQGTTDDDLGFTFSKALIVRSHSTLHEWVIVFGNGYNSTNGRAFLYILDLDGNLIKKIDTGVGGDNGLSTPSLVDVDGDLIADYAYAGDLKGNLWKFDLTDSDATKWGVAFGEDINDDGTINASDGDTPQSLFRATNQPITTKPDVLRHCERHGFIVIFGTGKFLSTSDRSNVEVQTLYGVWDYGDDEDNSEFLGSFNRVDGTLSNQPDNVTLLEQVVINFTTISGIEFRTLTNFTPLWATIDDLDEGQNPNPGSIDCSDGVDNDGDSLIDEPDEECLTVHAGWYFDLPGTGERIIKDPRIRERIALVLSLIPTDSPCSGGGNSFFYEIDACTGGRLLFPRFDIDYNFAVDNQDRINIGSEQSPEFVAPTGRGFSGILSPPVIVGTPGETEIKLFSSSSGAVEMVTEVGEKKGIYYWIER